MDIRTLLYDVAFSTTWVPKASNWNAAGKRKVGSRLYTLEIAIPMLAERAWLHSGRVQRRISIVSFFFLMGLGA